MRTDDTGFKLQPGAADGLGIGEGPGEFGFLGAGYNASISQSGGERNHLFLNQGDGQFCDVSGVATVDSPADARAFAIFDYDRDGWSDMVVVNSNAPATLLFRNQLGSTPGALPAAGAIAVRFVGSHVGTNPTTGKTARDGYGAVVALDLGETRVVREYRCGEGLAAQNSSTLLIGIGSRDAADGLQVRWPSGLVFELAGVPSGSLVTAYEDASQSPTGESFSVEPYAVQSPEASRTAAAARGDGTARERFVLPGVATGSGAPELVLYTTMATWCASCRAELPELAHLRSAFETEELELYGVPADKKETQELLRAYVAEQAPAYELLLGLSAAEVADVTARVNAATGVEDALPATILTDAEGSVLSIQLGAPSVSELRRILAERRARVGQGNGSR